MLRTSAMAVTALTLAEAFAPTPLPLRNSVRTAGCLSSLNMQFNGKPIDRKDGFGGGAKAIFETIEKRSKDDWSGSGTGGASGKIPTGPASFEEYMKKRASQEGGKVTDMAGNDITGAKPSYKVQEGAWGAPEDMEKQEDPLGWIDKSVVGFEKQSTNWLDEDPELKAAKEARERQRAEEEAAIEAKMQMWLKKAAEKKAAEGK